MFKTRINQPTSATGYVVPSRQRVDGSPSHPIFLFSSFCRFAAPRSRGSISPVFGYFRLLTEINGLNGFIFSPKPKMSQDCPSRRRRRAYIHSAPQSLPIQKISIPDSASPHPGFPMRKPFQSHILHSHPTFRCIARRDNCDPACLRSSKNSRALEFVPLDRWGGLGYKSARSGLESVKSV